MAHCGVASRRKCEEIITDGKVKINDIVVTQLGTSIDPDRDIVSVDGNMIFLNSNKVYIAFFKPRGVVSTSSDPQGRETVVDYFTELPNRVYPVGRLDFNTEGILIMTDDGDFANKVTHPSNEIDKVYYTIVAGYVSDTQIAKLQKGVYLDGRITAPAKVELLDRSKFRTRFTLTLHEGRNRQIRKMMDKIDHKVSYLRRESVGSVNLKGLESGKWRYLTHKEIKSLTKNNNEI